MQANVILSNNPHSGNRPKSPTGPRCDNYRASHGHLTRCRRRAQHRLTIVDAGEVSTLYRCQRCRDELHAQLEGGVTFAILDEAAITGSLPLDFQVSQMAVVLIGFNWAGQILNVTIHQWPDKIVPLSGHNLLQQLAEFLSQAAGKGQEAGDE